MLFYYVYCLTAFSFIKYVPLLFDGVLLKISVVEVCGCLNLEVV